METSYEVRLAEPLDAAYAQHRIRKPLQRGAPQPLIAAGKGADEKHFKVRAFALGHAEFPGVAIRSKHTLNTAPR